MRLSMAQCYCYIIYAMSCLLFVPVITFVTATVFLLHFLFNLLYVEQMPMSLLEKKWYRWHCIMIQVNMIALKITLLFKKDNVWGWHDLPFGMQCAWYLREYRYAVTMPLVCSTRADKNEAENSAHL